MEINGYMIHGKEHLHYINHIYYQELEKIIYLKFQHKKILLIIK